MLPHNQDSVVIIVDYKTTTLRTNPSISVARKVLCIKEIYAILKLLRCSDRS